MTENIHRPAFRFIENVGLQYHFFADNKAFSIRLVYRVNFCIHAAWIYDDGVKEIARSGQIWTQSDSEYLDIASDIMSVRDEGGELTIIVKADNGEDGFEARVRPIHTLTWMDTFSSNNDEVLHLPDLKGTLIYKGKTYPTKGYCKQVEWHDAPRYTGYRFLHGVLDEDDVTIWSADAVFGYKKYDYFKMVQQDGSIVVADDELSSHKQNIIYARIDGKDVTVKFEDLGEWELPLLGPETDMIIMQRYGRIIYNDGTISMSGVALTEHGFGKFADQPSYH